MSLNVSIYQTDQLHSLIAQLTTLCTAGRVLVTSWLPRRQTAQMRGSTRWSAW